MLVVLKSYASPAGFEPTTAGGDWVPGFVYLLIGLLSHFPTPHI